MVAPAAAPAGASAVATDAAIAYGCAQAGFAAAAIPIMVAVCLAESSGECWAVSATDDYGLAQINYSSHKDLFGQLGSQYAWAEPDQNLHMAYQVYNEAGGFGPWVTYQTGAYAAFLARGRAAASAPSRDDFTRVLTLVSGQSVASVVGQVGAGLPPPPDVAPLVRVLETVIGVGLLWLGLYKLTQPAAAPLAPVIKKAAKAAALA